jgi:glycosyltransferase involved in cell wall biosynthesis
MRSISIVIPIYKVDCDENFKHFVYLIESIAKNFVDDSRSITKLNEIVIVNDQIGTSFAVIITNLFNTLNLSEKLIYVNNPNNYGQAKSRNIGFLHTTGEYVHFIDQDDFIDENFYSGFKNQDEDVLIGSPHLFLNSKQSEIAYINKNYIKKLSNSKKISDLWVLLISNFAASPGQYLIKRSTFDLINGFPVLKIRGADDYGLLFRLACINASMKYNNGALFYYRIHGMQNRGTSDLEKSVIEFFAQPIKYNLRLRLKLVRYIRCRVLFWKILSKLIYSIYYFNFESYQ